MKMRLTAAVAYVLLACSPDTLSNPCLALNMMFEASSASETLTILKFDALYIRAEIITIPKTQSSSCHADNISI